MPQLRIASDVADFVRRPVGAGVLVETNFVWFATPSLGGSTGWGSPSGEQAERVMRVVDAVFQHPTVGPQVDALLDGYLLEQALHDEIAAHVARFSGTPPLVGELRNLLRASKGKLTVEQAGRQLGRSPRTLQRELEAARTSFREEQARARLAAVEEALAGSEDKVAAVAARIGLSAAGLNRLVRERMGTTLDAWRRKLRER